MRTEDDVLLDVQDLSVRFLTESGEVTAITDVNLQVRPGEIVGIVGESGCGKSVLAQSVARLHDEQITSFSGSIRLKEHDILDLDESAMSNLRGNLVSMVFQDPLNSLNPVFTVGMQIEETLRRHRRLTRREARAQSLELLTLTGIPDPQRCRRQYPHELSGGMRQRVMISIALACRPDLLIADEPTTALDVTVQAQVLDLIADLNRRLGMGVILITHDLGVVQQVCDRVVVMYLGQVIETASVTELFDNPRHPYTRALMQSMPSMLTDRSQRLPAIEGNVPPLTDIPPGCRFVTRCAHATEHCHVVQPALVAEDDVRAGPAGVAHEQRCLNWRQIEPAHAGIVEGVVS